MPRKSKVKTGCQTCRARKVKCDEGRPACRRCVSTGRTCHGYGIWGGGGNALSSSGPPNASLPIDGSGRSPSPPASLTFGVVITAEERPVFEWFVLKTARKLPGAFSSTFWDTLVLQATAVEPAVLHAVLALGSLHHDLVWYPDRSNHAEDGHRFTAHQYSKAISHLQPHFARNTHKNTKAGIRVALFACLIFISLEYLRGDYRRGHTHLRSGLHLLQLLIPEEYASGPHCQFAVSSGKQDSFLASSGDLVDDWIIETFIRLSVQHELLCGELGSLPRPPYSFTALPKGGWGSLPGALQARAQLDRILNEIGQLVELATRSPCYWVNTDHDPFSYATCSVGSDNCILPTLLRAQERLLADLSTWEVRYHEIASHHSPIRGLTREAVAVKMLNVFRAMARIKVDTFVEECHPYAQSYSFPNPSSSTSMMSRGRGEMVFDTQTQRFMSLITTCMNFHSIARAARSLLEDPCEAAAPTSNASARSIADLGPLPPLYYAAQKCRVPALRRRAVALMRKTPHKEGVWDSELVAEAAGKLLEMEEEGWCPGDEFFAADGLSNPEAAEAAGYITDNIEHLDVDIQLPPPKLNLDYWPRLPAGRRLRAVRVDLPDDSMGAMTVRGSRMRADGVWEEVSRVYDLSSRSWNC